MSPPSAAPLPRPYRCRMPKPAILPQAAARTVRPHRTNRRCAWRACNVLIPAPPALLRRRRWSRAAHVDVETVLRCGDLDVERLSDRYQWLGDSPPGLKRAVQARVQNGTAIDRDNVVRTCRRKTDLEHVVGADPGVQ